MGERFDDEVCIFDGDWDLDLDRDRSELEELVRESLLAAVIAAEERGVIWVLLLGLGGALLLLSMVSRMARAMEEGTNFPVGPFAIFPLTTFAWVRRCWSMLSFREKVLGHPGKRQAKGFSPVCFRMCRFKCSWLWKVAVQPITAQWCVRPRRSSVVEGRMEGERSLKLLDLGRFPSLGFGVDLLLLLLLLERDEEDMESLLEALTSLLGRPWRVTALWP